uniref:Uncharacterized protein n=1 Tax=Oryza sativa subsp. japonica TaxID=39947 RepID=Q5Z6I2_ORYSJ|nr:hypothetical protein [Oryza sativa Japonica Group]
MANWRRKEVGPARVKRPPGGVRQYRWRCGLRAGARVASTPIRPVNTTTIALVPRQHGEGARVAGVAMLEDSTSLSGAPKRAVPGLSFSRDLFEHYVFIVTNRALIMKEPNNKNDYSFDLVALMIALSRIWATVQDES